MNCSTSQIFDINNNATIVSAVGFIFTGSVQTTWRFKEKIISDSGMGITVMNSSGTIFMTDSGAGQVQPNGTFDVVSTGLVIQTGNSNIGWNPRSYLPYPPLQNLYVADSPSNYLAVASLATNDAGNVLMVGQPLDRQRRGRVLIYTGNSTAGWAHRQTLSGDVAFNSLVTNGSESQFGSRIGYDCAMNENGTVLVVGGTRSVYVYTGNPTNGWLLKNKIHNIGLTLYPVDIESIRVAMSKDGTYLIVGDPGRLGHDGRVSVYSGNPIAGWDNQYWAEIGSCSTQSEFEGQFGWSVSMSSDANILAIGELYSCYNGGKGAIYIYSGTNLASPRYNLVQILSGDLPNYFLSVSISRSGNLLVANSFVGNNDLNFYRFCP